MRWRARYAPASASAPADPEDARMIFAASQGTIRVGGDRAHEQDGRRRWDEGRRALAGRAGGAGR